ncbi:hypothetical protein [uncultured Eubacterium sp.]|uniref:hypothetical protein n=1 Tax=uncultured Eubacterium sp. TaxID=165185 RepID=UPI0025E1A669|nr:hypothetical protein [uncultured Eubacterium sp.]
MTESKDFSEAVASLASLRSLPPSAKTVHRTVFFRRLCLSPSLFESLFYEKKNHHHKGSDFIFGGEQGIFPRLPPLSPRYARCHRRQKQSTGLFSSESLWLSPSLFESLFIIKNKTILSDGFIFMAESKGFEPSNRL